MVGDDEDLQGAVLAGDDIGGTGGTSVEDGKQRSDEHPVPVSGHESEPNRRGNPLLGGRGGVQCERRVPRSLQLLSFESEPHPDGQAEPFEDEVVVRQGLPLSLEPDLGGIRQDQCAHLGGAGTGARAP